MPSLGPVELIIVLALALIVLGPRRLPEAGRGLGRGLREFKEGITGNSGAEVTAQSETSDARVAG